MMTKYTAINIRLDAALHDKWMRAILNESAKRGVKMSARDVLLPAIMAFIEQSEQSK